MKLQNNKSTKFRFSWHTNETLLWPTISSYFYRWDIDKFLIGYFTRNRWSITTIATHCGRNRDKSGGCETQVYPPWGWRNTLSLPALVVEEYILFIHLVAEGYIKFINPGFGGIH